MHATKGDMSGKEISKQRQSREGPTEGREGVSRLRRKENLRERKIGREYKNAQDQTASFPYRGEPEDEEERLGITFFTVWEKEESTLRDISSEGPHRKETEVCRFKPGGEERTLRRLGRRKEKKGVNCRLLEDVPLIQDQLISSELRGISPYTLRRGRASTAII